MTGGTGLVVEGDSGRTGGQWGDEMGGGGGRTGTRQDGGRVLGDSGGMRWWWDGTGWREARTRVG